MLAKEASYQARTNHSNMRRCFALLILTAAECFYLLEIK